LSQMRARDKAGLTHRHAVTTFSSFTHFGGELFNFKIYGIVVLLAPLYSLKNRAPELGVPAPASEESGSTASLSRGTFLHAARPGTSIASTSTDEVSIHAVSPELMAGGGGVAAAAGAAASWASASAEVASSITALRAVAPSDGRSLEFITDPPCLSRSIHAAPNTC
jgi:hypothetical protein